MCQFWAVGLGRGNLDPPPNFEIFPSDPLAFNSNARLIATQKSHGSIPGTKQSLPVFENKNKNLNLINSFTYLRSASSVESWSHWANSDLQICLLLIKLYFSKWQKKKKQPDTCQMEESACL